LITAPSDFDAQGLAAEFAQIFNVGAAGAGRQFSQELRVTNSSPQALEYTAGVFYSSYAAETHFTPGCNNADPTVYCGGFFVGTFDAPPTPPYPFLYFVHSATDATNTSKSAAAFGQLTYHLNDTFALLGGMRYTHQSLNANSVDRTTAGSDTEGDLTVNNFSWLAGVQYALTPDVKSYFKVVRGYKGPQVTPSTLGTAPTVIGAEIPTMFELGIKGASLERRLNWDADIFYSRVHDYQGQSCSLNPVGALACQGQSVSQVTTKGVEFNVYGQLARGLTVNAGYIYDIAKYPSGYTGYDPNNLLGGTTDLSGQQLVGVPKSKVSLSGEYAFPLNDAVNPFVAVDTVFKSAMRLGPSADPRFVYPKNWNTGLRLGVRSPLDTWSFALFARNLGKDREPVTLFGGPAFIPPGAVPFLPNGAVQGISGWMTQQSLRQVGLTADVKF
jgi:iron complex outermembrane receptor protein